MLPLAWGTTWRAVTRGKYYVAAAAALALTMAFHFITGYLAVLTVGVWVLVAGSGYLAPRRTRALIVVVGSLLDRVLGARAADRRHEVDDAERVLHRLDLQRLVRRAQDPRLALHGRPVRLGPLPDRLAPVRPRGRGLHRAGPPGHPGPRVARRLRVHPGALLRTQDARGRHRRPPRHPGHPDPSLRDGRPPLGDPDRGRRARVAAPARVHDASAGSRPPSGPARRGLGRGRLPLLVLAPAWTERAHYDRAGAALIRRQQAADATDGRDLERLDRDREGSRRRPRRTPGCARNLGSSTRVGESPCTRGSPTATSTQIGFTFRTIPSLSTDVEAYFDETNPAHYEMFNVRYLILPPDRKPRRSGDAVASSGRHRLWRGADERLLPGRRSRRRRSPPTAPTWSSPSRASCAPTARRAASTRAWRLPAEPRPPPTFAGSTPPPGPAGQCHRPVGDDSRTACSAARCWRTAPPSSCSSRRTTRAGP